MSFGAQTSPAFAAAASNRNTGSALIPFIDQSKASARVVRLNTFRFSMRLLWCEQLPGDLRPVEK